jgi:hypothetical protein
MGRRGSHIFVANRLKDGGEANSLTRRPLSTPGKFPGTHFSYRLSRSQGHSAACKTRSIEKSKDLNGNRILPACSTVPQPTMLPRARLKISEELQFYQDITLSRESREKMDTLTAVNLTISATAGIPHTHPSIPIFYVQ